jgi:hypothetical protein
LEKKILIFLSRLFWEYLFMPFGLTNAAQTFQRLMDRLFRHLPFVFTYLDDHLIASKTLEEHLEHLSQFFTILQENGLTHQPFQVFFLRRLTQVSRSPGLRRRYRSPGPPCHSHPGFSAASRPERSAAIFRDGKLLQTIPPLHRKNPTAPHRPSQRQPQGFVVVR